MYVPIHADAAVTCSQRTSRLSQSSAYASIDQSLSVRLRGMPEVIIELAEGRSVEQKRALVKDITEAIVRNCQVTPDAVTVIIHENPRTDKAKGGVLFSER